MFFAFRGSGQTIKINLPGGKSRRSRDEKTPEVPWMGEDSIVPMVPCTYHAVVTEKTYNHLIVPVCNR